MKNTISGLGGTAFAAAALATSALAATVASGPGWYVTNDHSNVFYYDGKISVKTCTRQSDGSSYSGGSITYSGGPEGTRTASTPKASWCGQTVSASMRYKDSLNPWASQTRMTYSLDRSAVGAVSIPVDASATTPADPTGQAAPNVHQSHD